MKILIITEFFPTGKDLKFSGGVEGRNLFVAKGLAKKNKVTIITSQIRKSPKNEKIFKINVIRVSPKRNYVASTGNLIERILFIKNAISKSKEIDADIVEGTNFISHFIAIWISKNKKIPRVAWYPDVWIGSWVKNAGIYGIFGEILERINLLFGFTLYVAISEETKRKLKRHTKGNIKVIPCAVYKSEFKKKIKKTDEPTIITISRLTKYKNIKTLILAFSHLKTKIPRVKLIIIGTGPEEKNLKNLSKALNVKRSIKFKSNLPRKELISLIKTSHIFSLPSTVEGFGIATIEAAAASVPYVNSNIPPIKEVTKNGKGGFLVDPMSPYQFSNKFEDLLTNKKLYLKKSNDALILSKNYDWEKISQETETIYNSLI